MGDELPGTLRNGPAGHHPMILGRCRAGSPLLILSFLSLGCGAEPPQPEPLPTQGADAIREVRRSATDSLLLVDATGTPRSVPAHPRRIVSLVPSATATLHALGVSPLVVGRTDFDSWPWTDSIPSVGGGIDPSLEVIASLRPDLVIRFAGDQDTRTPSTLDRLGIAHLAVRPDRIEDIYRTVALLGRATDRARAADSLNAAIRAGLDGIARRVPETPRPQVAYVLGGSPPWVAGPGTYIQELVALAGGDNAFADLPSLYASVTPEVFVTRTIDVVLLSRGADFDEKLAPGARIGVVEDMVEIPGPHVVTSAAQIADLLHGARGR